jgi:hypothetical protein
MRTITDSEFKSHFSKVIQQVKSGVAFVVIDVGTKQIVGYFLPKSQLLKPKRKLGIMEGKATVEFKSDYKITGEDMLGII